MGNSQLWNIHIASDNTLEKIMKDWIVKNKEGVKGYTDIEA